MRPVVPFTELGRGGIGRVGGKNASLGELTRRLTTAGLRVPPGFAPAADAYEELLDDTACAPACRTSSTGSTTVSRSKTSSGHPLDDHGRVSARTPDGRGHHGLRGPQPRAGAFRPGARRPKQRHRRGERYGEDRTAPIGIRPAQAVRPSAA
ncbi:hypothetical protein DEJ51_02335 [Streptomyces venezuelae]|uniref:Phosphoenolpyruvate synthase n=1 Tax=Streptomyces venezuelae TaxID=54571 RepID=A0A5P2DF74_STRVZ|nr:PEP/pyruvate-binding domain-containing protein [Streptomyces venezuelae]QES53230.1 hypothetical protein DEJ51_02335 [Streptomyces venezuelae]